MAEFKSIAVATIHIGERARPVDEESAQVIAASMSERGLLNPILVRRTPAANKGKTPYTLVAGGHRLRAACILEWTDIDVLVVEADTTESQLIELSENLFRNELSLLDRSIFVDQYRKLWEAAHGSIQRGGNRKSNRTECGLIFAPGRQLSENIRERFGFGQRAYEYSVEIGKKLHPSLRSAVRGTEAENSKQILLKLAKMPPSEQAGLAAALKFEPDITKHLALDRAPKPVLNPDVKALEALRAAWKAASEQVRQQFLAEISDNRLEVAA